MKKLLCVLVAGGVCLAFSAGIAAAEDQTAPAITLKEKIVADRAAVKQEKLQIKTNAAAAKQEEKIIKGQIKDAAVSGDRDTLRGLRENLKAARKENFQQKAADRKEFLKAKEDLKQSLKAAREARPVKVPKPKQ